MRRHLWPLALFVVLLGFLAAGLRLDPKAVLLLGKCGGLKKKNQIGDLVLPIAAILPSVVTLFAVLPLRAACERAREARERLAQAEANATRMVSEAISGGNVQAINYFVANNYIKALETVAEAMRARVGGPKMMAALEAQYVAKRRAVGAAADEADAVARAHAEGGALQQEAGAGTQLDALGGDGHSAASLPAPEHRS